MKKTKVMVAAAAALAVVVAAGCSSKGEADGGEVASPDTAQSSPSEQPTSQVSEDPSSSSDASEPSEDSVEPSDDADGTDGDDASFVCEGKSGDQVPSELVLALVPSGDAAQLVESAAPLTDYLTEALGIPVEGVVSTNYAGAVEAMGAGKAQIGMFAPLPLIQACQKYGAKIVLQSVREGSSTYHAQFFTNDPDKYCTISDPEPKASDDQLLNCNGTADATSGPLGLEEFKNLTPGTKVGLLDHGSTSGYIFPQLALINQGIDPENDIEIVQLEAHDQSVLAAYSGDIEVGVSYDEAREVVAKDKPDVGEKVVVFAYTDEIPNDGVALSGNLTGEWQDKITKVMQDFARTDEGKEALYDIYRIDDLAEAVPTSLGKVAEAVEKLGLTG